MKQVKKLHYNDQNFPQHILEQIDVFLADDRIIDNPREYQDLIREMKLEALLVTENSPYAEVRAVVENTDDPSMPSFTIRVWFIGIIYSGIGAAINQLFSLRQPSITITSEVAQLLAYPAGKLLERILPDKGFTMFGARHSLNPGPFNKKEQQVNYSDISAQSDTEQHADHYHGHGRVQHALHRGCGHCAVPPHLLQPALGRQLRL